MQIEKQVEERFTLSGLTREEAVAVYNALLFTDDEGQLHQAAYAVMEQFPSVLDG